MKKLIIFSAISIATYTTNAQTLKESDVPAGIKTQFKSMYPAVKERKWEKEDGKFEVSFKNNKDKMSLLFDANGKHVQTEVDIPVTSLPANAREYAAKHLKGDIKEAERITAADGTVTYEAEIGGEDYYFDNTGKFLRKEKDEKDGKEDDK